MRIRREDLYTQIWREAMTTVAKRLDVSSSYLVRVCESLNVPHPPRGYWARKSAGQQLEQPSLPPAKPGDPVEWVRGVGVPERATSVDPTPAESMTRRKATSRSPHLLVAAWRAHIDEAVPGENGYLRPRKRNVLDAFVTKGTVQSAAGALNALFVELENRGHGVRLGDHHYRPPLDVARRPIKDEYGRSNRWEPGRPTVAFIRNVTIGLALFELTEHVRVRRVGSDRYVRISDLPPVRRYAPQSADESDMTRDMPTGRLVLRAYSPRRDMSWSQEWEETAAGDFVTRASDIAEALEGSVPHLTEMAAEADRRAEESRKRAEAEWRAYRRDERMRARAEARRRSIEDLRAIVKAWNEAYALEAFFEILGQRAERMEPEARAQVESRIGVAKGLLGSEDALQRFLRWKPVLPDEAGDDGEPD